MLTWRFNFVFRGVTFVTMIAMACCENVRLAGFQCSSLSFYNVIYYIIAMLQVKNKGVCQSVTDYTTLFNIAVSSHTLFLERVKRAERHCEILFGPRPFFEHNNPDLNFLFHKN